MKPIWQDPDKEIERGKTYVTKNGLYVTIGEPIWSALEGTCCEFRGLWMRDGKCVAASSLSDGLNIVREAPNMGELIRRYIKDKDVGTWLASPNDLFGGEKPMNLMLQGRGSEIMDQFQKYASGEPS